jgi:hypothetical protein
MRIEAGVAARDLDPFRTTGCGEVLAGSHESRSDAFAANVLCNDEGGDATERRGTVKQRNDVHGAEANRGRAIDGDENTVAYGR